MATTFTKGQTVKVRAVNPQGPVQALRMDEDGNVSYLVEWTDADGNDQQRWFDEAQLEAA
jgi:cell envelope opacity-associated protein A